MQIICIIIQRNGLSVFISFILPVHSRHALRSCSEIHDFYRRKMTFLLISVLEYIFLMNSIAYTRTHAYVWGSPCERTNNAETSFERLHFFTQWIKRSPLFLFPIRDWRSFIRIILFFSGMNLSAIISWNGYIVPLFYFLKTLRIVMLRWFSMEFHSFIKDKYCFLSPLLYTYWFLINKAVVQMVRE